MYGTTIFVMLGTLRLRGSWYRIEENCEIPHQLRRITKHPFIRVWKATENNIC